MHSLTGIVALHLAITAAGQRTLPGHILFTIGASTTTSSTSVSSTSSASVTLTSTAQGQHDSVSVLQSAGVQPQHDGAVHGGVDSDSAGGGVRADAVDAPEAGGHDVLVGHTGGPSLGGLNNSNAPIISSAAVSPPRREVDCPDCDDDDDVEPEQPTLFGLSGLETLLDNLPWSEFLWPRLPAESRPGGPAAPPSTHPTSEFKDTVCTNELVETDDERRAARYISHFCARRPIASQRMLISAAGRATLFMCAYGGLRNCSADVWREASDHLDRACGEGGTGYTHLRRMRIGRDVPRWNRIICEKLHWSPLKFYRQEHREVLVDGEPYLQWAARDRARRLLNGGWEGEDPLEDEAALEPY